MTPGFWQGRRVFLTGHTGFKGSWLSLWLQSLGAVVTGYALRPPTNPSLFERARVADGMTSIEGDVRDIGVLTRALVDAKPEIVIHMAAQPLVRYSYSNPVETYSTNVMGTVNLLEAVRQGPDVKAVVVVTSDKCYENREWIWGYRENEPLGGRDPYSSSKGCAEIVTSAYRESFFSGAKGEGAAFIASARAGNVIGGGDWAEDRLVPDIIRALSASSPVVVRNPGAIRPWQHVLEPLSGYLLLAEKLVAEGTIFEGGWNFGPVEDDALPVSEIVSKFCAHWGRGASWQLADSGGPHEAHYLKLDCSKARLDLGWRPKWSLDAALKRIVQWHQADQQGLSVRDVTLSQIVDYQSQSEYK